MKTDKRTEAEKLYDWAFRLGREPRSEAYRLGALNFMKNRLEGAELSCPYQAGTVEFDAYFAGCDEGRVWVRSGMAGAMAGQVRRMAA